MGFLQMSFSGAVMAAVIVVVRALAVHKLPKRVFLLLWELTLLRLLLPFSIPSVFSAYTLLSRAEPVQEVLINTPAANIIPQEEAAHLQVYEGVSQAVQNKTPGISLWGVLWLAGMLLCAGYFLTAYLRCRREFQMSLPIRNGFINDWLREHALKREITIRQSNRISAPLTYGVLHPVILMPKNTDWSNRRQLRYVLMHEYTHICRFDTFYKLIATLAFCIHWFNPFVWILYTLYNRDMELSCDERVVRQFGDSSRSSYAMTLISLEETKRGLTPLCNNFSKNAIEERITAIMKMKKWTLGLCIISTAVVLTIAMLFATSAKTEKESLEAVTGMVEKGIEVPDAVRNTTGIVEADKNEVPQILKDLMVQFYTAFFDSEATVDMIEPYLSQAFAYDVELYHDINPDCGFVSADDLDIREIRTQAYDSDTCVLSLELRFPGEDSFTYLTVEFVNETTGWKIAFYGLEK